MATLEKFDDIPDLVCYVSADPGENVISKTGNDVDTVVADAKHTASAHPFTLAAEEGGKVVHDPATIKIGQMAAFESTGGTTQGLRGIFGTLVSAASPITLVAVLQQDSSVFKRAVELSTENSTSNRLSAETSTSGNAVRIRVNNELENSSRSWAVGVPYVHICTWDNAVGDTGVPELWVDNIKADTLSAKPHFTGQWGRITLNNNAGMYDAWDGKVGLVAVYSRVLTNQEVSDVYDLAKYWLDNGEAPVTGPPTSGDFTIAVDKPGAAGLAYQWEESADGSSWANVGTILTDISGATTDTLTVNSATVAVHQTYVRCQVTTDNDGFDTSDPAQLLIDGEPV